jgi:hypothetical protein
MRMHMAIASLAVKKEIIGRSIAGRVLGNER